MKITVEAIDTFTSIAIEGELDTVTAPELDQAIQNCISSGTTKLLMDLTDTEYVSSMGLRVFLSHLKTLKASGGRMVLCGLNEEVQEILDMAGFAPLFEIMEASNDAKASLGT